MDKRFEKIHIIICLLAAAVVDIFCIVYRISLVDTAIRLIATIIAFYIIGIFVKYFIVRKVFYVQNEVEQETETEFSETEDFEHDDLPEDEDYDYED